MDRVLRSFEASYEPKKNHAGHGCMLFDVGEVPAQVLNQTNRTNTGKKINKPTVKKFIDPYDYAVGHRFIRPELWEG